ncbi:hypothetical protein HVZ03_02270 [Escherichia fergusonii]|nr:hypothetical protein [Escherichia fergusonii]MBA8501828.1 hypothetical protein [Escherichia fergusonii]QME72448.1 hypothetical protein HVZ07_10630 [Escherichia fergusonii]QME84398.1 hypothetical protein HVZ03_02270 [Escherichia fergusonii]QME93550.1 hypothetical protein HVZ00_02270 [Escherichia fergusonii]
MIDCIYSNKNDEIYATIEFEKREDIAYCYEGRIVEFNFSEHLYNLIIDYDEIIKAMALSLLDEVEEEISKFDMRLMTMNEKVFCLVIEDKHNISFFTKYPTSSGFLDSYPW